MITKDILFKFLNLLFDFTSSSLSLPQGDLNLLEKPRTSSGYFNLILYSTS